MAANIIFSIVIPRISIINNIVYLKTIMSENTEKINKIPLNNRLNNFQSFKIIVFRIIAMSGKIIFIIFD